MYKLIELSSIRRLSDGAVIPTEPQNSDYREYLMWLEAGNLPESADPVPVIQITTVTIRQAKLALLATNKLALVNQAIAAMGGVEGQAAQIEWDYTSEVKMDSPLVTSLAYLLELDAQALQDLFNYAATL